MAKTKRSQPSPDAMPFELKFVGEYGDGAIEADLVSPMLDPAMHRNCTVRVVFDAESTGKKGKPRFALDSFHVTSLFEYLRSNAGLRQKLEASLQKDRKEWDVEKETAGKELWSCARVLHLGLRRRDVPNPKHIEDMRRVLPASFVKAELAAYDPPDTKTFFTLVLDCDWDDEHQVKAEFRDGKFLGLNHE